MAPDEISFSETVNCCHPILGVCRMVGQRQGRLPSLLEALGPPPAALPPMQVHPPLYCLLVVGKALCWLSNAICHIITCLHMAVAHITLYHTNPFYDYIV